MYDVVLQVPAERSEEGGAAVAVDVVVVVAAAVMTVLNIALQGPSAVGSGSVARSCGAFQDGSAGDGDGDCDCDCGSDSDVDVDVDV